MKQDREVSGGENPQEGGKPWRGNVPGQANPGMVDFRFCKRCRGSNPMRGMLPVHMLRAAATFREFSLKGRSSPGGDRPRD